MSEDEDTEGEPLSGDETIDEVVLSDTAKKRLFKILKVSDNDLDGAEEADLQEGIHKHLMEYASKKKLDRKTVDDLTQVLEEYLSTFLILGYNFKGEPVQIVSVDSQQNADALGTAIHRFLMHSNRANLGPDGPEGPPDPGMYE
tara:strand:+ start:1022 stop:1453 length:432 start_codon:yes stop_codon:yes gene_type:complete